jgi:hypothetical protein
MKNLILIMLICLAECVFAQVYSYKWTSILEGEKLVKVTIKDFGSDAISVSKEFATSLEGNQLNTNTLVMVGDFKSKSQNSFVLDFVQYEYYFIPFDPSTPFIYLDKHQDYGVTEGVFKLGDSGSGPQAIGGDPKEVWYYCTCGGHNSSSTTPGGDCLATIKDGTISCGGTCSGQCLGKAIVARVNVGGGGIFLQTDKSQIYHNFATGQR